MSGIGRHNGLGLSGDAHLGQSVIDILSTPLGSRVMRRDYGSELPNLIDHPINGETIVDVFMATAEALDTWEPRLELQQVAVTAASAGFIELELTADIDGETRLIPAIIGEAA